MTVDFQKHNESNKERVSVCLDSIGGDEFEVVLRSLIPMLFIRPDGSVAGESSAYFCSAEIVTFLTVLCSDC